jgi:hypothetical protein
MRLAGWKSGFALPDCSWFIAKAAGNISTATSAGVFRRDLPLLQRRQAPGLSPLPPGLAPFLVPSGRASGAVAEIEGVARRSG